MALLGATGLAALLTVLAHAPAAAQGSQPGAAPSAPATLTTPVAMLDAFHAALQANRTEDASALLSPALLIYEAGHAERSKAEYAGHHLGADAAFAAGTRVKVLKHSERTEGALAVITRETETTGSYKGAPVHSFGTETAVLERQGDGWRIVHLHWSSRKGK